MADLSLTNSRLGRYEIKERIGKGGMAQVFKAFDSNLDRIVAVKVLYENLSDDPTFKERFEREAKFVASFNHPNIMQIYDFDSAERAGQHVYFMVMPYIAGQTLKDLLAELTERGKLLPKTRVLQITHNLAEALDYAHARGMVHRDVKPGNILFDERDQAVLTDFGIARLVANSGLTQEGLTVGTPAYMSPEQATGENVDARSDIYALGVIVYEMLAGHPPFGSDSSISILLKHLHDPVPSLTTFTHMADAGLDAVIFKAMAKAPEDRFQTATAFADALEAALEGRSTADLHAAMIPAPVAATNGSKPALTGEQAVSGGTRGTIQVLTQQLQTVTRSPLGVLLVGLAFIGALVVINLVGQQLARSAAPPALPSAADVAEGSVESMSDDASVSSMAGVLYFNGTFDSEDRNVRYWPQGENEQAARVVTEDGFYRFSNLLLNRGMTSIFDPAYRYKDASISMTARLEDDSAETAGYGIVFRYIDPEHYNVFTVDGQGRYSIWAREAGQWRELRGASEAWTPDEAINPIGEVNSLTVDIINDEFTGYVNGEQVVQISDDTFDEGAVGIYLASTASGTASLLVDSFSVNSTTAAMTVPGDDF